MKMTKRIKSKLKSTQWQCVCIQYLGATVEQNRCLGKDIAYKVSAWLEKRSAGRLSCGSECHFHEVIFFIRWKLDPQCYLKLNVGKTKKREEDKVHIIEKWMVRKMYEVRRKK